MKLKDVVNDTAERLHYMMKKENYTVNLDKKGVDVKKLRPTKHTIKWGAKNH
ncbi:MULTISPECIES: hypothetical protein [Enterococcus]|uniref:Uncharacterized protein n=1 Tax=Enterococcus diestrammenae TaxID=1155073 RepID=A0ABV0F3J0_9ENTE|nr:hypothetical protein [Enterococcus diestrammenae]HIX71198.1 hypothetical protein [Candidatus Enterococcus stercoravium]